MFSCALTTLGCKVNQCETEALAELMENNGFEIVDFNKRADVYIINTCCVTAEGERKSRQLVRRAISQNSQGYVVVTGCAAQRAPEEFKDIDGVSLVVGNTRKKDIPALVKKGITGIETQDVAFFDIYQEMPDFSSEKTRAFIKIQDGCNNFCSYCIIPYVRGRERSRNLESIVNQCATLAKKSFKEIVINGIHLSSYGKEWGYKPDLADVVESISMIDGVERVRLGSLEPNVITDEFLRKVTRHKEFCMQFHLSLQAGSDSVLKRMNRKYTTKEYLDAVKKIRSIYPLAAISTDIITGFPGETEEEFLQTKEFCKNVGFAWVHVFPYSVRQGTVAAKMDGQLPKNVKASRAAELIRVTGALSEEYRKQFVGKVKKVLCENNIGGVQYGLTDEHISVRFEDENSENQIVEVLIKSADEQGLLGERIK